MINCIFEILIQFYIMKTLFKLMQMIKKAVQFSLQYVVIYSII